MNPEKPCGYACIRSYLAHLDHSPGVYRMLDAQHHVLYVGKAKSLKNRVGNYAQRTGHTARIARMIEETRSMLFLTTQTETEALLLEQNLIKQLKPRYNVLLRDDKSFPYIYLDHTHPFPRIQKHYGKRQTQGKYFGPFASAPAVTRTLTQLRRVFLLRDCTDSVFTHRTRPCLQYQIKRCSAPCVGKISLADYSKSVQAATDFLTGKNIGVQDALAQEMRQAAKEMAYERAAALRDRIRALTAIQTTQGINPRSVQEADIFALHCEADQACVQVFFIRSYQNWGNREYYPDTGQGADEGEVLRGFIGQFYNNRQPARQIILSHPIEDMELMQNALVMKAGYGVRLVQPKRGEKLDLLRHAQRNARESLARKMAQTQGQLQLLARFADRFAMSSPPKRIEVYDNSHIQGAYAVGAMIVAGPEGLMKKHYRTFNIKGQDLAPGDDFGMMKEVLSRRFGRLLKDHPDKDSFWPDVLLIDGGAGQIESVHSALEVLGISDILVIGVAKGGDRNHGNEEFYIKGQSKFALPRQDPLLYYIQRLRDEAHRFAIGTHRKKRQQSIYATPLDAVPGIGAARKRALLAHFGSAKAVTSAHLLDLKAVNGISDAMATTIYNYFHDNE